MNSVTEKPSSFYRDMFRLALPIVIQSLVCVDEFAQIRPHKLNSG